MQVQPVGSARLLRTRKSKLLDQTHDFFGMTDMDHATKLHHLHGDDTGMDASASVVFPEQDPLDASSGMLQWMDS